MAGIGVKWDKVQQKYREWDGKKFGMALDPKIQEALMGTDDPDRSGSNPPAPPVSPSSTVPSIPLGPRTNHGVHPLSGITKAGKKPLSLGVPQGQSTAIPKNTKVTRPPPAVVVYMGRQYAFDGTVNKGGKWKTVRANGTLGTPVSNDFAYKLTALYFPAFVPKIPLRGGKTMLPTGPATLNLRVPGNLPISNKPKGYPSAPSAKTSSLIAAMNRGTTSTPAAPSNIPITNNPKGYPSVTPSAGTQSTIASLTQSLKPQNVLGVAPGSPTSPGGSSGTSGTPAGPGGPKGPKKPTVSAGGPKTPASGGSNLLGDIAFNTAKTNMILAEILRRNGAQQATQNIEYERRSARKLEHGDPYHHRKSYRKGYLSKNMNGAASGLFSTGLGALLAWTLLPDDVQKKLISQFSGQLGDVLKAGIKVGVAKIGDVFNTSWEDQRKRMQKLPSTDGFPTPPLSEPTIGGNKLTNTERENVGLPPLPAEPKNGGGPAPDWRFYAKGEGVNPAMDNGGIAGGLFGKFMDGVYRPFMGEQNGNERFYTMQGRAAGKLVGEGMDWVKGGVGPLQKEAFRIMQDPSSFSTNGLGPDTRPGLLDRYQNAAAGELRRSVSGTGGVDNRPGKFQPYYKNPNYLHGDHTPEELAEMRRTQIENNRRTRQGKPKISPNLSTQEPFMGPQTPPVPEETTPTLRPVGQMSPEEMIAYLVAKGVPEKIADVLTRNLGYESNYDPTALNSDGGGNGALGMAGWRGDRQDKLKLLAEKNHSSPTDLKTQLDHIVKELHGDEKSVYKKLLAANERGADHDELNKIAALSYFRFQEGHTEGYINRSLNDRNNFPLAPVNKDISARLDEAQKKTREAEQATQRNSGSPVNVVNTTNNVGVGSKSTGPIASTQNDEHARIANAKTFSGG